MSSIEWLAIVLPMWARRVLPASVFRRFDAWADRRDERRKANACRRLDRSPRL